MMDQSARALCGILLALVLWGSALVGAQAPASPAGSGFTHPGGLHSSAQLQAVRRRLADEPWRSAYAQLRGDAAAALSRSPQATEDFDVPAYYRDPQGSMAAKQALSDDAAAAYALALAYQLDPTEQRVRFAAKAVELLEAWARTNRRVSGGDGDLVLCYAGLPMVLAADLLSDHDGWSAPGRMAFQGWVKGVFCGSADRIKGKPSNWGAWGTCAAVAVAHLLDDRDAVAAETEALKSRIADTIAPNGELPHENRRTNSGMWYTYFALAPTTVAAQIILNATGTDLFTYQAPDGRPLRQALDRLFAYSQQPEQWPYRLPPGLRGRLWRTFYPAADHVLIPTATSWPGNLFEAMATVYREPAWDEWLGPHRPIHGGRGWVYPTLMR